MDRRATFSTLLGRQQKEIESKKSAKTTATTLVGGLDPFTGTFDRAAAAHLLRRVSFGPTYEQIKQAEADGLAATIAKIFTPDVITELPINHYYESDPNCSVGEVWVDKPYVEDDKIRQYRARSLYSWTGFQLVKDSISIQEKLILFWHNHFVIGDIDDPKFVYNYYQTLRENALGNFRDFTKAITVNAAMLRYLNGNQNVATSPNENFARELVELFTVGKGDLVGPGDYTNYTEDDIQAMARVLTGRVDVGYFAWDATEVGSIYVPQDHDNGSKQLSNRFGNAVINGAGSNEYSNLIDVIFQQPACARHICTKLYRWFISDQIDDEIQTDVIEPMAQLMISSDYDIQPVLEALFSSEHFFSDAAYGCVIKSPMDYLAGLVRSFEMSLTDENIIARHLQASNILEGASFLGMAYFNPPSVAGWKAYYQEPGFHRIWINAVTLPNRIAYSYIAVNQGFEIDNDTDDYQIEPATLIVDGLKVVNQMDIPTDPNEVIREFALLLLPRPLSLAQITYLKAVLIPGLPDFEWEVEYLEYIGDPDNENLAIPVRTKLNNMLTVMVTMAEFQLM